jgi:hypothetical protein
MAVIVPIIAINNSRAERIACGKAVEGYRHDGATVEEARAYSRCIDMLHPSSMSPHEAIALKVAIVVVLLGAVGGFVFSRFLDGEGWLISLFIGPLMGAIVAACSMAALWGAYFGVRFLFS